MTITVVAATTQRINQHAEAIRRTQDVLPIESRGLLISPRAPVSFNGRWAQMPERWSPAGGEWPSVREYSRFLLFGLKDFIETDHCIVVHWDGYGVNRNRWTDDFLEYDYIGAPWPPGMNPARVGNGGFSLRSKRWLSFSSTQTIWHGEPEDDFCCRLRRRWFECSGLKIAPLGVAARWSLEHRVPEFPDWQPSQSFGFHGFFSDTEQYRLPKT